MTHISRRVFLRQVGRSGLVVAAFGVAACTDAPENPSDPVTTQAAIDTSNDPDSGTWSRVALGSVSAYVFARDGEAALVDTGRGGSATDIADVLGSLGLGWPDLSTVILTHSHGDHVGSLADVMALAPDATAYAGAEDIADMNSPRPIATVVDGDSVFGLEVITTPGHTPGHISILDPDGTLVAGDALNGSDGGVIGPNPDFTADMETAQRSVVKLAGFDFDEIYFGHGEPVTAGGSEAVTALTAGL